MTQLTGGMPAGSVCTVNPGEVHVGRERRAVRLARECLDASLLENVSLDALAQT